MLDALWQLLESTGVDLDRILLFLPSRRAVRSVEKMIVKKVGHSVLLPQLVALGEGVDGLEQVSDSDSVSNLEQVVVLAKLLAQDASVGNFSSALQIAHDLVRMNNYLENEGIDAAEIDWESLIDEKYAVHFQNKAKLLGILANVLPAYANGRLTDVQKQNKDIRGWIDFIKSDSFDKDLVVVCGSTASVPATADLMAYIATMPNGRIILSGKISGREQDFLLNTNPYNAEYKFLKRIGVGVDEIVPIDVGQSVMDFFNVAFGNDATKSLDVDLSHCHLIEAKRESEEALAVAEIAKRAIGQNKSVLVITPDAAANQRIAGALAANGIDADFSAGFSGTATLTGRAILNLLDSWIENSKNDEFDKLCEKFAYNLFNVIEFIVSEKNFEPDFDETDSVSMQIWNVIKKLSDYLILADIKLNLADCRALLSDVIGTVSIRGQMNDEASVVVLGTIESRMQTADVVILTGLNEGMFPTIGYENSWLPRNMADKVGLPSPDRKVSLMALDFMNLSCGKEVYWLRSKASGGVQTTESRFLSRVAVKYQNIVKDDDILKAVRGQDVVESRPLDYSAPNPPADWSDVYVTELEKLIHNPYVFYVSHILRLKVLNDYWALPDARDFGNIVHDAIEKTKDRSNLVAEMDKRALELLGQDSILFYFWHKRFVDIAPVVQETLDNIDNLCFEIEGKVKIEKRNVVARADCVWPSGVLDFKTGEAPKKKQLQEGMMPQLPLEAFILQNGGFPIKPENSEKLPVMMFLQLRNNDIKKIVYDGEEVKNMINAAVLKTKELFQQFSAGNAPYVYLDTNDKKYQVFDDLARRLD